MLALAGGVFAIYLINVFVGAAGMKAYLSDVTEMLTLFVACIVFVVAVLWCETAAKQRKSAENRAEKGGNEA